jgi:hypothetical protein
MILALLGAATLAAWAYLLVFRGGFWRVEYGPPVDAPAPPLPGVAAVIPARNEAAVVGQAIRSLAGQGYAGEFHIVLVDDSSSDGTAAAARAAAAPELLTVVGAALLPEGWTGKLWAVSQGVGEAERRAPEYLLLTDADITHPPSNLNSLVARAQRGGYDLVSYMARLSCRTTAERALMPAFVFFFFLLYPPAWICNPRRSTAAAAGGCMLVRRDALAAIGGIGAICGAWIDDCALAARSNGAAGRCGSRPAKRHAAWLRYVRRGRPDDFAQRLHPASPLHLAAGGHHRRPAVDVRGSAGAGAGGLRHCTMARSGGMASHDALLLARAALLPAPGLRSGGPATGGAVLPGRHPAIRVGPVAREGSAMEGAGAAGRFLTGRPAGRSSRLMQRGGQR